MDFYSCFINILFRYINLKYYNLAIPQYNIFNALYNIKFFKNNSIFNIEYY